MLSFNQLVSCAFILISVHYSHANGTSIDLVLISMLTNKENEIVNVYNSALGNFTTGYDTYNNSNHQKAHDSSFKNLYLDDADTRVDNITISDIKIRARNHELSIAIPLVFPLIRLHLRNCYQPFKYPMQDVPRTQENYYVDIDLEVDIGESLFEFAVSSYWKRCQVKIDINLNQIFWKQLSITTSAQAFDTQIKVRSHYKSTYNERLLYHLKGIQPQSIFDELAIKKISLEVFRETMEDFIRSGIKSGMAAIKGEAFQLCQYVQIDSE